MSVYQAAEGDALRSGRFWLLRGSMLVSGVLLGFLLVLVWNIAGQQHTTSDTYSDTGQSVAVPASPAPDFDIPLYESDARFRLSDHRGKGVVINFWASWCHPCREEAPILEEGWRTYKDRGVVFVGVNVSDSDEEANAFLHEFGVTYPNGPDLGGEVSTRFRLRGLPETFFVDPNGGITRVVIGSLTTEKLTEAVEVILPK